MSSLRWRNGSKIVGDKQKATIQALTDANVELEYDNARLTEDNTRMIDDLEGADEHITQLEGQISILNSQLLELVPFAAVGRAVTDAINGLFPDQE